MSITTTSASTRLRRLECLRGAAASYVFLHHYVHVVVSSDARWSWLSRFFVFGQLAVLLFFIVSGFVIFYSTAARGGELRFGPYFNRRFRRIYPPFLLALCITWAAESFFRGRLIQPNWVELTGNLLMLQDGNVASWFEPFLGNAALWSLSYEWAFYMLFFLTHRAFRSHVHAQRWVVFAVSLVGFVTYQIKGNQLSLFVMYYPVWWAGVEICRELTSTGRVTLRGQFPSIANLAALSFLWLVPVRAAAAAGHELISWKHPVIELRHFATATMILAFGLLWHQAKWQGFYRIFGFFERVAPISYGIYIVHYPVVRVASLYTGGGSPWLQFVLVLPTVLGLAWIVENLTIGRRSKAGTAMPSAHPV